MDSLRNCNTKVSERPGPSFCVGQVWKLKEFKAELGGDADRKWLRLKRAGLQCWDEGGCSFVFIDQLVHLIITKTVIPSYEKNSPNKPKKRRK